MRLWHKELISILPEKQLLGQWRECCLIARELVVNGSPNHILVNEIVNYPLDHFVEYSKIIYQEMINRGYSPSWYNFGKWFSNLHTEPVKFDDIFYDWHTDRYYWQCYYNLEEKYDRGSISEEEWQLICDEVCLRL